MFTVEFLQQFSSSLLNNFLKLSQSYLKNEHSKKILRIELALLLNKYTPKKRLIGLKWFLNNFSTILKSQFNYHTLPVTPFKCVILLFDLLNWAKNYTSFLVSLYFFIFYILLIFTIPCSDIIHGNKYNKKFQHIC